MLVGKLEGFNQTAWNTCWMETNFSWVEFDGHPSGIGIAIKDGESNLLIRLVEFMSIKAGLNVIDDDRMSLSRHYLRLAVMVVVEYQL